MPGHYINIYFSNENYQKLEPLIQQRKVSKFVNQVVEKALEAQKGQQKGTESEEEIWRRAVRLASQDQQRNKEIVAWDKISSKVQDK